jgi:hypothetical protein
VLRPDDLPAALRELADDAGPCEPPVEQLLARARRRYRRRQAALPALASAAALAVAVPIGLISAAQPPAPAAPAPAGPAPTGAAEADYLMVLLPTQGPGSEAVLPVPGLDRCLALPGAEVAADRAQRLVVSADGPAPQRQDIASCLRGLDRVRVLQQSGRDHLPVTKADALTPEQARRPGVDGTQQCQSAAVRNSVPAQHRSEAGAVVIAGYLTDAAGYEQWEWEYEGSLRISPVEPPFGEGLYALCWFRGDIPPEGSVGPEPAGYAYQLLAVQLTGRDPGLRRDARTVDPPPILAPPPPAPRALPQGAGSQVFHPQPQGIIVAAQPRRIRA